MISFLKKLFGSSQDRTLHKFSRIVKEINEYEHRLRLLSDAALRNKTEEFKERIRLGAKVDDLLVEAYAVVKNVCRRLCGTQVHVSGYDQKWDMIPYDVQLIGAIALHHGFIAEMQTGEGKTLTATLPLYLNALTGQSVHLITVNDYLAERDCEWTGSILRWLGLSTGVLTQKVPAPLRKSLYQSDVLYGTASEFGFDYLRDNSMASRRSEQVQRNHFFAIIDEIDSILIDEARTPLIISGPTPDSLQMYDQLKEPVFALIQQQRILCNQLANEAKLVLDRWWDVDPLPTDKKERESIRAGCKQLWVLSKGMPNHKTLRRSREHPDLREEIDRWDTFFHGDQNKEEKLALLAQLLIVIDEKGNEFELTDKGIRLWSAEAGGQEADFMMLDLGAAYADIDLASGSEEEKLAQRLAVRNEDAHRKERAHNIRQLMRGHLLMEKDVDYIVEGDKIVIIDEHTGRPQPGRRFSDGLHQAIEAKENVAIQQETQTYASITLQNYFRLYQKLAGMTGTAITEAREFKDIYQLEVLQIPTYKPCNRKDENDEVYMTEREKYQAILTEIKKAHDVGRPILIGTESVEVSEKLSRILRQHHMKHNVLNAKYHGQEAAIIAEAGHHGAITVATNMAGRGTDIKLKDHVAQLGGLHVIGTSRHQSRRIDRQLRGRSARLGDPGSSKFFISFEDPLMRLFASPRLNALIQRFRPPEGEPISASMLNRSIETAQKRVEARNYMIRKHTLEYDDVMNKQRQEVYHFRNEVLQCEALIPFCCDMIQQTCMTKAEELASVPASVEAYNEWVHTTFPISFSANVGKENMATQAVQEAEHAFKQRVEQEQLMVRQQFPMLDIEKMTEEALRSLVIGKIDSLWQEHLLVMDHLRIEVNLRAVAQKDPLIEFKHEAFALFHQLTCRLQEEVAKALFQLTITPKLHPSVLQQLVNSLHLETSRPLFDPGATSFGPLPQQEVIPDILTEPKRKKRATKTESAALAIEEHPLPKKKRKSKEG